MSTEITKNDLEKFENEQNVALKNLRELIEKNSGKLNAEDQEKLDKIDKAWDKCEDFNKQLQAKLAKDKKLEETVEQLGKDIEEKASLITQLEKKVYRMPNGSPLTSLDVDAAYSEIKHFMTTGSRHLNGQEYKYLRSDNNEDGGFLVPDAPLQSIVDKKVELSPMREYCTVMSTTYNEVPFPVRLSDGEAFWVGEGETIGSSTPKYGLEKIPLHELGRNVPITMIEMQDSAFNMESEISFVVGRSFAKAEDVFINGNGVKKPEGFLENPYIQVVESGIANSFSGDNIAELDAELKTDYRNPIRFLTRKTLKHIRTLKDGQGQYLLVALRDGLPPTINGYPYKEMPGMPEIGAGTKPMAFGDFSNYAIIDRIGMTMIRDPYSNKLQGIVDFLFKIRLGGMTIQPEGIKVLQCKA